MEENQNNQMTGRPNSHGKYHIIAIAACAVVLIALGIYLGYKLTKKDTPKETPTVTPTEAPKDAEKPSSGENAVGAGEWVLSKAYEYSGEKRTLNREREYFYDEQGRMTEMKCNYVDDASISYTEYYSYDHNGEKMERWIPSRGGKLDYVEFTDMTGTKVYVDLNAGETYQEEFYDDGFIKEFRIYGGESKKLEKLVKWEYDAERKNIRRIYYKGFGNGEPVLIDDLRFELDSEGRVVRYVDYEDRNEDELIPSATGYECRYEGNRRIETYTYTNGASVEVVYEGDRFLSKEIRSEDGTGNIEQRFYPNINSPESEFIWSEIEIEADGTETPLYKVEFTDDGQPLRKIELETGEICTEYQYGSDGKSITVLSRPLGGHSLLETSNIKLDEYGNVVEYTDDWMGTYARYEWIRLSDAEQ